MSMWTSYMDSWNWRADRVGDFSLRLLASVKRFFHMAITVGHIFIKMKWVSRPAVMNVLVRQIYFTGVQNLSWVLLIALGAGVLAVYNIVLFARQVQDLSLIGSLVNGVLVQEMAPFMVAIFLLTRSGVAVITEIGNMHVRGEDAFLRSVGISPYEYLHLPRILAFAMCGLVLTFLFVVVSIWVGGLVVAWGDALSFSEFLLEVQRGTTVEEIVAMMVKGMCFPMLSCMVLLDQGGRVGHDPNQMPIRATNGVLGALVLMLLLDAVWVISRSVL
ncbi:MAG: ABC transporter permease [Mariprofundaceae bacterium]